MVLTTKGNWSLKISYLSFGYQVCQSRSQIKMNNKGSSPSQVGWSS